MTADDSAGEGGPIWEGLLGADAEGPYLVGGKCTSCGHVTLGVRDACPDCWKRNMMTPVPIGRTGTLYTCTVIHQAADGYVAPFAVGYVDLPEGVRLFAHLANEERSRRIGASVQLTVAPLKKNRDG